MNNLKFRAYFEQYERMIDNIGIINQNMILVDFTNSGELEPIFITDKIHVMQSTGLFDKNGVEIFEGDIVRNTHTGSVGRVHWCVHNTGFFYYVEKDKKDYTVFRANHNLEVIGNVYENKELIQNEI